MAPSPQPQIRLVVEPEPVPEPSKLRPGIRAVLFGPPGCGKGTQVHSMFTFEPLIILLHITDSFVEVWV